jgi:hypothetical protein
LGGQFAPKSVVNLDWKVVVNLTVFSTQSDYTKQNNSTKDGKTRSKDL